MIAARPAFLRFAYLAWRGRDLPEGRPFDAACWIYIDLRLFSGKARTREKIQVIVFIDYCVFVFEVGSVAWQLQEICTAP